MTIKPTVTEVETSSTVEWLGHLGFPGVFDGRYRFELEATENGTRFIHSERFNGVLVRPLLKSLNSTKRGFEAMNAALKARAEAHVRCAS